MPIITPEIRDRKNGQSESRREIFGFGEIFGTRPSMHLTDEQRAQRFWMGVVYAPLVGYWVIGLIVFSYAVATWDQSHRYLITASSAAALIFAATFYCLRYQIVALSWRLQFFEFLNFISFACLTFVCVLDNGANSVLTFLLFCR